MIHIANDPAINAVLDIDSQASHRWLPYDYITDVLFWHFALDKSRTDRRIMRQVERRCRGTERGCDGSNTIKAYGRLAPYLTALDLGGIGSIFNADSYALMVIMNAMMYLDETLRLSKNSDFLAAEAEYFQLVERFGLEAEALIPVKEPKTVRLRGNYVLDELSPKFRAIYVATHEKASQLLRRKPSPLCDVSTDSTNSLACFPRGQNIRGKGRVLHPDRQLCALHRLPRVHVPRPRPKTSFGRRGLRGRRSRTGHLHRTPSSRGPSHQRYEERDRRP
jgi:hypothetical protein